MIRIIITVCFIGFLIFSFKTYSQSYFTDIDKKEEVVNVYDESKKIYKYPWAGGMNSCQFGEVDLNLDGIKDLFVFDRNGNRIMTFLNNGTPGTVDYFYAPEYKYNFPELFDWVILADYNMDGKSDIFTYSPGWAGIRVFKNISENELKFEIEIENYLTSFQGGGDVNILVTYADYPGIADIDNDGDLDILTFWGLGSFVEYHQNQSMENYGIPDSLDFIEVSSCWGHFAENDESNIIYLDTCINGKNYYSESKYSGKNKNDYRHTGSTFLTINLDGDEDKDLLLGDVDYPNLIQLINGGTPDSAWMTSQDGSFPSYDMPIDLFSMPVASYIDINNNGINDLLVSPFDPSPITSENHHSVWLYNNTGTNDNPEFNFEKDNFIQDEMIDVGSGACPVLFDYDKDGLKDLFVSNYGYYMWSYYESGMLLKSVYWSNIALYKNTGSLQQPAFNKATHDFAGLHSWHLTGIYPTFGDIDGDNDDDMIIGHKKGTLMFFENIAGPGQVPDYNTPVEDFQNINVGAYSTPQLFDLNADGLLDLIIGKQTGMLNYYENTGTEANPDFTFVTDFLGHVNVTDSTISYTGFSTPCFFRDNHNELKLLVGSERGKIFYFIDIEDNLIGEFTESDLLYELIGEEQFEIGNGMRTGATISDLNHDGYLDLIVGNYSGGLNYYSGIESPEVIGIFNPEERNLEFNIFPNPASDKIFIEFNSGQIKGGIELVIYDMFGSEVFVLTNVNGNEISIPTNTLPSGVYICRIASLYGERSSAHRRFVISR
jgi:hypothetical protein